MKGRDNNFGNDADSPPIRRYQFGLSNLLMAMTILAILLGLWMWINYRLDHNLRDFFYLGAFFLVCSPVFFCLGLNLMR